MAILSKTNVHSDPVAKCVEARSYYFENSKKLFKGGLVMDVLIFVVGVLIGCIFMAIISRVKSVGSLRVDTSDPDDSPYLFLELSKDVDEIYKKKYVTLTVNTKNFIPHE